MSETSLISRIVSAKHPEFPDQTITLGVHPATTRALYEDGQWAAIGEWVGLIKGKGVLMEPSFIFQGLNRPYLRDGAEDGVFAYISKPYWTHSFAGAHDRFSGKGPEQLLAPKCSVFVTFVTLDPNMVSAAQSTFSPQAPPLGGAITAWEWTMATDAEPNLPENHAARYRRRVWPPK